MSESFSPDGKWQYYRGVLVKKGYISEEASRKSLILKNSMRFAVYNHSDGLFLLYLCAPRKNQDEKLFYYCLIELLDIMLFEKFRYEFDERRSCVGECRDKMVRYKNIQMLEAGLFV